MKPWKIVFNQYCSGLEKIYSAVQAYLPYVLICDSRPDDAYNSITVLLDPGTEGFEISVSPAKGEAQQIEIRAENEINLLYAASDFKNICLPKCAQRSGDRVVDFYEYTPFAQPLLPYHLKTRPRIQHRGLWTWGHKIYDYRKYIDALVTLKMNTLIIWNDYVPVNIGNVISYAHQNGVEVYLGYAWGWDTDCAKNDIGDTSALTEHVIGVYQKEYASLSCDGIYFQSFTELAQSEINGVSIADAVIRFVNRTAGRLFAVDPDLKLLFGIHGTSVKQQADKFAGIDPRVRLVWEDLGAFPFHNSSNRVSGTNETRALVRKLQELPQPFGAVLKGGYRLDWSSFEHQKGRFVLGVCDDATLKNIAGQRKTLHKTIQADWIKNAPAALEMIRLFREDSLITVLAEDGALENDITYPVALYAQMLWDSDRTSEEIIYDTANMPDVKFF